MSLEELFASLGGGGDEVNEADSVATRMKKYSELTDNADR